jgi:hypothetical protein
LYIRPVRPQANKADPAAYSVIGTVTR